MPSAKVTVVENDARASLSGIVARADCTRYFRCWLLAIVIIGLMVRIAYVDNPYFNRDENIAQAVVRNLDFPSQWDTNWARSEVEKVYRYDQYNFSSYHYLLYLWKGLIEALGINWQGSLGPLRIFNGIFGVVLIAALAWAVRRAVDETAGIAAASAAAIMPLFVQDAHYLRGEAMLTGGMGVLLLLCTGESLKNRWTLFFGGLLAGWLAACKVTMVLAFPLFLPLLFEPSFAPSLRSKSVCARGALIGLGVVAGFVCGVPWGVAQPQVYLSGLATLSQYYNAPMPPNTSPDMAPSFVVTLVYMRGILGWGFWALAALGARHMLSLVGFWRVTLLLLPLAAAYFVFGKHAVFAERNFSPFLPIAIFLFGAGTSRFCEIVIRHMPRLAGYRSALLVTVLSVPLILPAIYTWQIVYQGFSGREQIAKDNALFLMKRDYRGKKLMIFSSNLYAENYREIAATITNHESMLIILVDFYDPYSPSCLATLTGSFSGHVLGVRESIFSDLPTCSLHTLISPRLWLIYIPAK